MKNETLAKFGAWFAKRTPAQMVGLVAVVVLVVLHRDSLLSTPDDWKAWIGVVTTLMAAAGVASGTKEGE